MTTTSKAGWKRCAATCWPSPDVANLAQPVDLYLQDEEDDDFKGGLEALRGHVLAFPKDAKLGAMDRDMNDDNLMVGKLSAVLY